MSNTTPELGQSPKGLNRLLHTNEQFERVYVNATPRDLSNTLGTLGITSLISDERNVHIWKRLLRADNLVKHVEQKVQYERTSIEGKWELEIQFPRLNCGPLEHMCESAESSKLYSLVFFDGDELSVIGQEWVRLHDTSLLQNAVLNHVSLAFTNLAVSHLILCDVLRVKKNGSFYNMWHPVSLRELPTASRIKDFASIGAENVR